MLRQLRGLRPLSHGRAGKSAVRPRRPACTGSLEMNPGHSPRPAATPPSAALLWSALPVLLVLCLSAKLLSLGVLAGQAATGFDARRRRRGGGRRGGAAGRQCHRTAQGTFRGGRRAGPRRRLRRRRGSVSKRPLPLAGRTDECVIRVNLVLSIERLGDARRWREDADGGGPAVRRRAGVVDGAAPAGCLRQSAAPDAGRTRGRSWKQAEARLRQKSGDAKAGGSQAHRTRRTAQRRAGQPPTREQQTQLEQLNESPGTPRLERNTGHGTDEYLRDGDYRPGTRTSPGSTRKRQRTKFCAATKYGVKVRLNSAADLNASARALEFYTSYRGNVSAILR